MTLYKITHSMTGKCYIGQTVQELKKRLAMHFSASKNSNRTYIKSAIQKYGKESFTVDTIGEYKTLEDLNNAEEYYIDWYNCLAPNGYNLHTGGNNHRTSEETRKKQSLSHVGKPNPLKGVRKTTPAWNKGLKCLPGCGFQKGHKSFSQHRCKPVVCSNGSRYPSITLAAKELNTSTGKICAVIKGNRKSTKGYTFKYTENI